MKCLHEDSAKKHKTRKFHPLRRQIAVLFIGLLLLSMIEMCIRDRIHRNYRRIVGINGTLIALGVTGVIQPTTSALLHNTSTLLIGMDSMKSVI